MLQNTLQKLLRAIRSPKFFWVVVLVFLLQGAFFALAVKPSEIYVIGDGTVTRGGGVVPDGNRHIGAIHYFAEQPILNGPFIQDMTDSELWMGDLERFPSYLYYYITSFPVRAAEAMDVSDETSVMVIRFVGLLFGLLALIVFRKVVRELKAGESIVNMSSLALALTGSFAWLAPAENYDVLALLFFFLFMLAAVRLVARNDATQLYFLAVWFSLGSITKYTYLPFMGLFGLVALIVYVRQNKNIKSSWRKAKISFSNWLGGRKWLQAMAVLALLVAGGLFAERIGVNLVQYQSVSPNCSKVHSQEACMNFGVYERNYNRTQAIEAGDVGEFNFNPIEYTGYWLYRYYTSMYTYLGHVRIDSFWPVMYVALGLTILLTSMSLRYLKDRGRKILDNSAQRFAVFAAVTLVLVQFIFNLQLYINYLGMAYGHQGRYLLPAIGFLYVLVLLIVSKFIRDKIRNKNYFWPVIFMIFGAFLLVSHTAIPLFLVHASGPEWFNPTFIK